MKENKKAKKVVALLLCAVLLVVGSVSATVAYLTDSKSVTNTFTVGKVAITLDEARVDEYGVAVTPAVRVAANEYKLIPGHTYVKDPTIHVAAESEACWLFVKVENGLEKIIDSANTINAQLTANGWTPVSGATNVYAYAYSVGAGTDVKVFEKFQIAGSGVVSGSGTDTDAKKYLDNYKDKTIKVTAYAIQTDGFASAQAVWDAANSEL